MFARSLTPVLLGVSTAWMAAAAVAAPAQQALPDPTRRPAAPGAEPVCGTSRIAASMQGYLADIRAGRIVRPPPPVVAPASHAPSVPGPGDGMPVVQPSDIFLYPDYLGLLLTDFTEGELIGLMTDAANALLSQHGDEFDFVGFWVNFVPHHQIGVAFYLPIANDTLGIGNVGAFMGRPQLFDLHEAMGLAGTKIDGFVMMWNVDDPLWFPGEDGIATRLVLGQEAEHRWATFLPPLLTGEQLQGDDAGCGRGLHWNFKVDGQGSAMEISEWVGVAPAVLVLEDVNFNTDIPGGLYSYTDLYLMGYVSPDMMDLGNSELRYMKTSDCVHDYTGTIKPFSSADIVAVAGPRVPSAPEEQHVYRTGWIMIYQGDTSPSAFQLGWAAGILTQRQIDWSYSTLGLGSMLDILPPLAVFTKVGAGLAGSNGVPEFTGVGSLAPGTTVTLTLTGAKPLSISTLIIGLSLLGAPFKGGVMVPDPDVLVSGLPTGIFGSLMLNGTWPAGVPSGVSTWYQHWIVDAAGPKGFAASNGLLATTP